jgi:thiamine-phosphate pyrophosphorylase
MFHLDRLYAITDRNLAGRQHDQIVVELLAGGARLIQIRDKEASGRDFLDLARACVKLARAAGARLIVNDRVDIALAADADGVHLGQDDLDVAAARALLGPTKVIGLSTHSLDQYRAALATSADYLAVGPIYATRTKDDHEPVVGLELIRRAREIADRPLVAIGGITLQRAAEALAAGADSIAVISALYPRLISDRPATESIGDRTRTLLRALGAR